MNFLPFHDQDRLRYAFPFIVTKTPSYLPNEYQGTRSLKTTVILLCRVNVLIVAVDKLRLLAVCSLFIIALSSITIILTRA